MKLYKTKEFARLARKNDVSDEDLKEAVHRAEEGLVDANLGANFAKVLAALDDAAFAKAIEKRNWKEVKYEHSEEDVPERRASVASPGSRGSPRRWRD
jgi:hypothetical protein